MKAKILIIDDADDIREITRQLLEGRGYEVIALDDGEQALETILATTPTLILLDNILTGRMGSEICHEIKSNEQWKDIPIIMTTGNPGVTKKEYIPPDAYLLKPFDIDELITIIEKHLKP